jgi:hypothetical protein
MGPGNDTFKTKNFYLYVYGDSFCQFLLSAQVKRSSEEKKFISFVKLPRDHYLEVNIRKGESFAFEIDLEKEENITLKVTPLQGLFDFFIGDDKFSVADKNNFKWSS